MYPKSLAKYLAIAKDTGLNHTTSIRLVNTNYTKSGIASCLIRLKNPESGFFNLLGGQRGSIPIVFPLWLNH